MAPAAESGVGKSRSRDVRRGGAIVVRPAGTDPLTGRALAEAVTEELRRKLQVKDARVALLNAPPGFALSGPTGRVAKPGEPVLLFCTTAGELQARKTPLVAAALRDELAWLAYPKAGKLGSDLSRDGIQARAQADGLGIVRMVSLDETWSAARLRPLKA